MTHPIKDLAADPAALAARLGPDAAVAAAIGGDVVTAGSDAVLRPGSVTKVITAVALLQCVDDGLVDLDDDVARWVPRLNPDIRVRHLLSHSSGLDAGDVFVDTGDDDGCLERYLELVVDAPQLFPPGHTFSYNNAGMVMAGHIAALARDKTYEDVVRERIFEPAGMDGASFDLAGTGDPICSRALAPAGGTLACTASDLVRFAVAPLVAPATAALMARRETTAPGGVVQMTGTGLGWQLWHNEHGDTLRHGGAYPGHSALLTVDPAADAVLAVMTPTATGINAINAVLDPQDAQVTDAQPESLDAYVGEYRSHAASVVIDRNGEGLQAKLGEWPAMPIAVVDRTTFTLAGAPFAFFDFDDAGAPRYLRFRMRVQRRA